MGNRRFKLSKNDVLSVLEKLGLDVVIIDLPDNKTTYKALAEFDWDFYEAAGEPVGIFEEDTETEVEKTIYDCLSNFNDMATYIEAAYQLAQKSPAIMYGSEFWDREMRKTYDTVGSEVLTIDHTMISTFLSSYYNHFLDPNNIDDKEEIIKDIDKKLKEHWKEAINHPSVISFVTMLFKK